MIVTNYEGQVIEFTGTEQEALDKGYNVNCSDCSYCSSCSYCSDCSNCSRCSSCSNCSNCSDCSNCSRLPIILTTDSWQICIRNCTDTITIGCQTHPIESWMSFTDTQISDMHQDALPFWKTYKPIIELLLQTRNVTTECH